MLSVAFSDKKVKIVEIIEKKEKQEIVEMLSLAFSDKKVKTLLLPVFNFLRERLMKTLCKSIYS